MPVLQEATPLVKCDFLGESGVALNQGLQLRAGGALVVLLMGFSQGQGRMP